MKHTEHSKMLMGNPRFPAPPPGSMITGQPSTYAVASCAFLQVALNGCNDKTYAYLKSVCEQFRATILFAYCMDNFANYDDETRIQYSRPKRIDEEKYPGIKLIDVQDTWHGTYPVGLYKMSLED